MPQRKLTFAIIGIGSFRISTLLLCHTAHTEIVLVAIDDKPTEINLRKGLEEIKYPPSPIELRIQPFISEELTVKIIKKRARKPLSC